MVMCDVNLSTTFMTKDWREEFPFVFESEVEAVKRMLPEVAGLNGIELPPDLEKFSKALDIKDHGMAIPATGIPKNGVKRQWPLPFPDMVFDFVLTACCTDRFHDLHVGFEEVYRVLKNNGRFILGFLDRESSKRTLFYKYQPRLSFLRNENFFATEKVVFELHRAGFKDLDFCQTLFRPMDQITSVEPVKAGYGEGAFVVIKAGKQ